MALSIADVAELVTVPSERDYMVLIEWKVAEARICGVGQLSGSEAPQ